MTNAPSMPCAYDDSTASIANKTSSDMHRQKQSALA
eukprot:CAMPEP_0170496772 /NCGR_PEP_ID=MMETSP0208-20121228/22636_1 /TAXON_ID=197538 /ORGANISM="Strombidium inclinatum, Strain S3" /LENGTH=35 /DNA_ID= /DNA_START= /DNA_END= /DNA_ORIENTATION=